jgi:hypothetical protein
MIFACVYFILPIPKIVCIFILLHPALTPILLEKWVLSACGADSAVCNMKVYKQLSLPPFLPRGGGLWGGGLQEFGGRGWGGSDGSYFYSYNRSKSGPFVL